MRLGILGYGESAWGFATAANVAEGVKLAMIGGRNVDKAREFAAKFRAESFGSTQEMLARDDLDCAAISTPPGIHADGAIPFAEKGVHLMVEKPMALTVADCKRIIEAAERNQVKLMVTQTQRYGTLAQKARELIASGTLGKPIQITLTLYHDYFTKKRTGWQLDPAMSGGGVTMNPFIHMIDLARYLSLSEVNEASGAIGYHKEGFQIDGDVRCLARFENGASAFVYVDGYGHSRRFEGVVALEQGALVLDFDGKRIEVWKKGRLWETLGVGPGAVERGEFVAHVGYLRHVEEMRDAIEKGGPIASDGYNGMKNVEIAQSILAAAANPRPER
jgi:predicted dehydrogenase